MDLDVVMLSRIQFALTVMFHYLFPPLTIGLGAALVVLEGSYLRTGDKWYESATKFWVKIFAATFAVGVATGIVMEFQFGTNWATYSRFVGDVFGSALAAEGIFAFFLESGFLAVLVFGWDRVSPRMHFFSTLMVSLGSIFSSIWIVVANSWQQTPAGFHMVETEFGPRAEITDFWALVFNPSTVDRLVHVWIAAFILGGFFIMSISAFYLLKNRHVEFAKRSFRIALLMTTFWSVVMLVSGHSNARMVAAQQPAKLAAMEAHYKTGAAGLHLFGIPDNETEQVKYGVQIPGMLSFLIHGDTNASVPGLDELKPDIPPVGLTFQAYHIMVALGILFIVVTLYGCFLLWRGTLYQKRWLLWVFVFMVIGPYIANQLGWMTAEVGRQPWVVYGLLRTDVGVSRAISAGDVAGSLVMFGFLYVLLFIVWIYVLNAKIQQGPELPKEAPEGRGAGWLEAAAQLPVHAESLTTAHKASDDSKRSGE